MEAGVRAWGSRVKATRAGTLWLAGVAKAEQPISNLSALGAMWAEFSVLAIYQVVLFSELELG